jgi:hypothetical protein
VLTTTTNESTLGTWSNKSRLLRSEAESEYIMKKIVDNQTTSRDIEKAYNSKKYIVLSNGIYQPFYSEAQKMFYAQQVYVSIGALIGRGRFTHYTGKQCNNLINIELLEDLV